jgi:hypothetical protein
MFPDLHMPTESQFRGVEDLLAALRPVEVLTKMLCQPNFNVLEVQLIANKF